MKSYHHKPEIPETALTQWQAIVDLLAKLCNVPAALIMTVNRSEIEVVVSAHTDANPYEPGEKAALNTGLYCEEVMRSKDKLCVPDALADPKWDHNPDIELGMISYLGYPLLWPDGDVLGTICILDRKANPYSADILELLVRFQESINMSLALVFESEKARLAEKELHRAYDELEQIVEERTVELKETNVRLKNEITERTKSEEALKQALGDLRLANTKTNALLNSAAAFLQHEEFEDAARILFDNCKQVIGATSGYVALLNEDGSENEVLFLDSGGLPCTVDESLPMPIRGLRGDAYRTGKAVYDNSFLHSKWIEFMPEGHVALKNVLFAPIVITGEAVGLIGLANKPQGFTETDANIAMGFAQFAAVGLSNYMSRRTLKESEDKFRSMFESASESIYILDSQGTILETNPAATSLIGYAHEELVGNCIADFFTPASQTIFADQFPILVEQGFNRQEVELISKNGKTVSVDCSASAISGVRMDVMSYMVTQIDITQRKQAEERERAHGKFLASVLKSLTHPFYVIDVNNYSIVMANPAAFTGSSPVGSTCYSATHGSSAPCNTAEHPCPVEEVKKTRRPTMVEHRHCDENGRPRTIAVHAYPVFDDQGRVIKVIEYCLDITETVQAQEDLRENERTLATILSMSPSGICYVREGTLAWTNKAMRELFGYGEDEIRTYCWARAFHEFYESDDEYEQVRKIFQAQIADGRPVEAEARLRRKDGSTFFGNVSVSTRSSRKYLSTVQRLLFRT